MDESACFKRACADLDKHPSKAVAREKRRAQKQVDECSKDLLNGIGLHDSCSIVYANACTGFDEYRFDPATSDAKP